MSEPKKAPSLALHCPTCHSRRVTQARLIEARGAANAAIQLTELHISFWNLTLTPGYVEILSECLVCVDCGLVWTTVRDPNKVRVHVNQLGTDELKERIFGSGSALPRPADHPAHTPDELPRPSDSPCED
jgi:uncharacterized Zn finger protein